MLDKFRSAEDKFKRVSEEGHGALRTIHREIDRAAVHEMIATFDSLIAQPCGLKEPVITNRSNHACAVPDFLFDSAHWTKRLFQIPFFLRFNQLASEECNG